MSREVKGYINTHYRILKKGAFIKTPVVEGDWLFNKVLPREQAIKEAEHDLSVFGGKTHFKLVYK